MRSIEDFLSDADLILTAFISRLIKQKLQKRKRGKKDVVLKPRWEDDYELVENEGLFAEYLEMGINL